MLQCETELLRIERDRASDIRHLIAEAMNVLDEGVSLHRG
jgi:hypothetical protein